MKHVVILVACLGVATARAAISFGPAGTGVITFDTLPSTNEWATHSIAGSSGSIFTEDHFDAAVQTVSASAFTNTLLVSTLDKPNPATLAGWSSTRLAVFTGPAGVAAETIMATLRNDSGSRIFSFQVAYDFDVAPTFSPVPEELPGHRFYFSLTGDPGTWWFVPDLSGETNVGSHRAFLDLHAAPWAAGENLYLLWVQDNASHSPDSCYLIDNFFAGPEPPPPPCFLTHPTNTTIVEGQPVTFLATPCPPPPFHYQWFKDGAPIDGARNASYLIPHARLVDAGHYWVVLTNSTGTTPSEMATLTVIPDDEPPRALIACRVDDTNSALANLMVVFSERVDKNSAETAGNYSLRSVAVTNHAAILDASLVNETTVVLQVENLTPGISYFLEVNHVTDQSVARHTLSPNPTTLPVQSFGPPIVPADYAWKYFEAPTEGDGSDWMRPDFDDSVWPTGAAAFGLGFDEIIPPPFVVRTFIRTPDIGGPITTYFRTGFDLPAEDTNVIVQLSGVFDEGAIVYLNGTELWRVRLPNGPVTPSTVASNAWEPHLLDGPINVYVPGVLHPGANSLAVELHQVSATSGDVVMGLLMRMSQWMGCLPALTISRSERDGVSVNWTCGGTLQASPTFGGPPESWHNIVTQTNSFTTNMTAGALFFRVRL